MSDYFDGLTEMQIERLKEAWARIAFDNPNARIEDYRIVYHQLGNDILRIDYVPREENDTV